MKKQPYQYESAQYDNSNSMKIFIQSYPFINYQLEIRFLVTLLINWHSMLTRNIDSQDELSDDSFSTSDFYPFVSMAAKTRFMLDFTKSLPPSPVLDFILMIEVFECLNQGWTKEEIMELITCIYRASLSEKSEGHDPIWESEPYPAETYEDFDIADYDMRGPANTLIELTTKEDYVEKSMYYYTKKDYYLCQKAFLGINEQSTYGASPVITWVGEVGKVYLYPTILCQGKGGQVSFIKNSVGQVTFNHLAT